MQCDGKKIVTFLPGQYFLASAPDLHSAITPVLFPCGDHHGQGIDFCAPIPSTWRPGDEIDLYGPCGNGFGLPEGCLNLILAPIEVDPQRLLPLMQQAFARKMTVALFCDLQLIQPNLVNLPAALEIYPTESLPENLSWADFVAIDISLEKLPMLPVYLGVNVQATTLLPRGQVLVRTAMPCAGKADCGVCAIKTRSGWRHVCKDGPVFSLHEVLHVAG